MTNALVGAGEAESEALSMAGEIATRGPVAVRSAKVAIDQGLAMVRERESCCGVARSAELGLAVLFFVLYLLGHPVGKSVVAWVGFPGKLKSGDPSVLGLTHTVLYRILQPIPRHSPRHLPPQHNACCILRALFVVLCFWTGCCCLWLPSSEDGR